MEGAPLPVALRLVQITQYNMSDEPYIAGSATVRLFGFYL